jgi:anti-sigma factor RsiW
MAKFLERLSFTRDHRWAPGAMSAYLDRELAPSGRGRMDRHVGDCPECRRLLAGLRRTLDALHRLAPAPGRADAHGIAASVRLRLGEPPRS